MIGRIFFTALKILWWNRVLAVIHQKYSLSRRPRVHRFSVEFRGTRLKSLFPSRSLYGLPIIFPPFSFQQHETKKTTSSMSILLAFHWYVSHCFIAFHRTMQFGRHFCLTMDVVRQTLSISTSIHLQFLSFYSNTNLKGDSLQNRWILILWILTVNQKFWCLVFYCWFTRIYRNNQGPSLRRRIPHSIVWRRDD